MKAFIDTNILIDYICKIEPFFIPAKSVFAACFMGRVDIVVSGVINGLKSDWLDYEDFLQYETAIASNCDCIITRNPDDFSMSRLPVYNALDFMLSLRNV